MCNPPSITKTSVTGTHSCYCFEFCFSSSCLFLWGPLRAMLGITCKGCETILRAEHCLDSLFCVMLLLVCLRGIIDGSDLRFSMGILGITCKRNVELVV